MTFSLEKLAAVYEMIGPAGAALILVALFAVYLSVWQLIYMNAVWRSFKRDFLDLERGNQRCLRLLDPKKANPLIRIIYEIVTTHGDHSDDIRAEVGYLFHRNFKRVTNGLCWLKLISVVSPLLGLLGTVWGMVDVIPVLMCYYYLMLKFKGFHIEAIEHSYRALEVMRRIRAKRTASAEESIEDELRNAA